MYDTIIAVPSYGRANVYTKFCSINHISFKSHRVVYYVEPEEVSAYRARLKGTGCQLRTANRADVPKKWGSIMDLIVDECCHQCNHLVIMDDDLKLDVRPDLPDCPTLFTPMTHNWFDAMVSELATITTYGTPLTSTQYRQFCQCKTGQYEHNQRISMIWSMNAKFFRDHPEFRFYRQSRLDFMSDYYLFCSLLQAGYPNLCINRFTKDDKPNAPGGEKEKRSHEVFNRAVQQFAGMFPGFVSVREKRNKGNWKDGMLGVTIQASKMYASAKKKPG